MVIKLAGAAYNNTVILYIKSNVNHCLETGNWMCMTKRCRRTHPIEDVGIWRLWYLKYLCSTVSNISLMRPDFLSSQPSRLCQCFAPCTPKLSVGWKVPQPFPETSAGFEINVYVSVPCEPVAATVIPWSQVCAFPYYFCQNSYLNVILHVRNRDWCVIAIFYVQICRQFNKTSFIPNEIHHLEWHLYPLKMHSLVKSFFWQTVLTNFM